MRAFVRQHGDAIHLRGHEVLSMVTSRAARALGLENEIGTIEKGKKSDLILVDISQIPLEDDFLMSLIKGVNSYHIKSVRIGAYVVKSMN